jgi:uncharacterized membrane protein
LKKIMSVILTLAIVATIGALIYINTQPKIGEEFTDFYILGIKGKAIDYPQELAVGEKGNVIVGIVNHENHEMTYRVAIFLNGETISEIGPIVLMPEDKCEKEVSFIPRLSGDNQKVQFILYENNKIDPLVAPLYLWIDVTD